MLLPLNRLPRLYIMLDRKTVDFALVKVGITADTLQSRFHCYKTSNPLLSLVAICEPRKNKDYKEIEKNFFDFLKEVKGFEHIAGEWLAMTNERDIEDIKKNGFRYFEKLFYSIKNNSTYNIPVYQLWSTYKR